MRKTILSIVAIVAVMGALAACDPAPAPTPVTYGPPVPTTYGPPQYKEYPVKYDFQLTPGIPGHNEAENPTLCYDNGGDTYICRVIIGLRPYSQAGPYVFAATSGVAKTAASGASNVNGYMVFRNTGDTYEGCQQTGAYGVYWTCNYHTVAYTKRDHGGKLGFWGLAFANLWGWTQTTVGDLSCASVIALAWYGAKVTVPGLADCSFAALNDA